MGRQGRKLYQNSSWFRAQMLFSEGALWKGKANTTARLRQDELLFQEGGGIWVQIGSSIYWHCGRELERICKFNEHVIKRIKRGWNLEVYRIKVDYSLYISKVRD